MTLGPQDPLVREFAEGVVSGVSCYEDQPAQIRRLGRIVARLDAEDPFWELDAMAVISELLAESEAEAA